MLVAINSARPGQRIVLANGVHRVDKPIKITRSNTGIAAQPVGDAVFSTGGFEFGAVHGVTIEGFVFSGTSSLSVPAEAEGTRITRTTFNGDQSGAPLWCVTPMDCCACRPAVLRSRAPQVRTRR
ncbi:polysaccharide lyase domain-containing protein [Lentzea nigeriaca]|uniref:hypothetical protein n=1 Tax=Lentzea nigeriaca TaxID=1128665 RepID=UPI00195DCD5E|nr:hypothetical protein [Lentzea nigeriaca]MBM7864751.1 hypothetical protein [Lentzea nigeriaca]